MEEAVAGELALCHAVCLYQQDWAECHHDIPREYYQHNDLFCHCQCKMTHH